MNILGPSWKTTVAGLATILSALAHVADSLAKGTPVDWTIVTAAITSGAGLIAARDKKVSSEQEGVTPKPVVVLPQDSPTKT